MRPNVDSLIVHLEERLEGFFPRVVVDAIAIEDPLVGDHVAIGLLLDPYVRFG